MCTSDQGYWSYWSVLTEFFLNLTISETCIEISTITALFVVHLLSQVQLFEIPWTTAHQASLSFTVSQNLLKLMFNESMMPSNHLILCHPLLFLPSIFPRIRSFPVSWLFTLCGQSTGASASASVLPMNIQDWFPLGWTGLIFLEPKGLLRVLSNITVQKHQFFGTQIS